MKFRKTELPKTEAQTEPVTLATPEQAAKLKWLHDEISRLLSKPYWGKERGKMEEVTERINRVLRPESIDGIIADAQTVITTCIDARPELKEAAA